MSRAVERVIDDVAPLDSGEEKHVVLVWNGDDRKINMYVDGRPVAEGRLHFDLDEMTTTTTGWGDRNGPMRCMPAVTMSSAFMITL